MPVNMREEADKLWAMAEHARAEGAFDLADLYDAIASRVMLYDPFWFRVEMTRGLDGFNRAHR